MVLGKFHVETWPRPLPSRRRIAAASAFVTRIGASLLRILQHGRSNKLLKARIIPERIEHGIEPEQGRSERHVGRQRPVAGVESSFSSVATAGRVLRGRFQRMENSVLRLP
jgi:hypothetical protein